MTEPFTIVPASVRHIRPMSACMRSAAAIALQGYGFNPREALRRALVSSFYCRTAMIDGKPAAMWGVAGTLLGVHAYVWLVLSPSIQRFPRALLRRSKAELAEVMADCREITTTVLPDDEASIRFALHLGFRGETADGSEDEGERGREIMTDPRFRIPMGEGYVIRLGYHPEAR